MARPNIQALTEDNIASDYLYRGEDVSAVLDSYASANRFAEAEVGKLIRAKIEDGTKRAVAFCTPKSDDETAVDAAQLIRIFGEMRDDPDTNILQVFQPFAGGGHWTLHEYNISRNPDGGFSVGQIFYDSANRGGPTEIAQTNLLLAATEVFGDFSEAIPCNNYSASLSQQSDIYACGPVACWYASQRMIGEGTRGRESVLGDLSAEIYRNFPEGARALRLSQIKMLEQHPASTSDELRTIVSTPDDSDEPEATGLTDVLPTTAEALYAAYAAQMQRVAAKTSSDTLKLRAHPCGDYPHTTSYKNRDTGKKSCSFELIGEETTFQVKSAIDGTITGIKPNNDGSGKYSITISSSGLGVLQYKGLLPTDPMPQVNAKVKAGDSLGQVTNTKGSWFPWKSKSEAKFTLIGWLYDNTIDLEERLEALKPRSEVPSSTVKGGSISQLKSTSASPEVGK